MPRSPCPRSLRGVLASGVLMIALLMAAPPAAAGEDVLDGGHRVAWDPDVGGMGRRVAALLPETIRRVEERLGFAFVGGPAEVHVVSGLGRMRAEAGVHVPVWAAGVCVGSRSRIVLRADLLANEGPVRGVVSTLRHEWVHLAWARRARAWTRHLPLWVEEGLAEEIGGGISVDGGQQLDFAAAWGRLLPMEGIATAWPDDASDAALAYRQGRNWVQYFVQRAGWPTLQRILADLAEGRGASDSLAAAPPFDELVFVHTGSTLSGWIASWRSHLKETAAPLFYLLLRDFTGTILFVVAVAASVGYWFLRRRRKREISELPDDPLPPGAEDLA